MVRYVGWPQVFWRLSVQIGDLVQLLDVHGKPESDHPSLGIVTGFTNGGFRTGLVKVYWPNGFNHRNAAFQWGRLKVINESR
jgi:hypothetical protein